MLRLSNPILAALFTGLIIFSIYTFQPAKKEKREIHSKTAQIDALYAPRAYPSFSLPVEKFNAAFNQYLAQRHPVSRDLDSIQPWKDIGPKNIGGRTLCLAFNPQNPSTMYAGSAGGGLWRSYTGGEGVQAWFYIPTGFPVLGVGAIAVSPADSNTIFIGTGEMYNYQSAGTGFVQRLQRGSYGIGILKSTDNGLTWSKSLDWQQGDMRGIQDLLINPINPNSIWAATTGGLYHSADNGATWVVADSVLMADDIQMDPSDTTRLFFAAGFAGSGQEGVYRSTNGGQTFQKLGNGLPPSFGGKALFAISQSNPLVMFASIANAETGLGLFKSSDGGDSWTNINPYDFQSDQGWYSHDVIIYPFDTNRVFFAGVEPYESYDGGNTEQYIGNPNDWWFSVYPIGGPEGPSDYVHSDFHRMYFCPQHPDTIYFATDGGVFRTIDTGTTFQGLNGSYQTTQFYSKYSNSTTDSFFSIGGLQDNSSVLYNGTFAWIRVLYGDGTCTAIDPTNDQNLYGADQWMDIYASNDRGNSFFPITQGQIPNGNIGTINIAFNTPYALSYSNPQVLYAGTNVMWKSTDAGNNWQQVSSDSFDHQNPILHISISPTGSDTVYATTAPVYQGPANILKSVDGGNTWTVITGSLPNRYLMQVGIRPGNEREVFVVVSGFGTQHIYKSTDGGNTWAASGNGLPDLPTNSICIDPLHPDNIFVGNDLGVYFSSDDGVTWQAFSDGFPDAVIAMDLSISPSNRKLRVATHGSGVYERDLPGMDTVTRPNAVLNLHDQSGFSIYPNPATGNMLIQTSSFTGNSWLSVYDMSGNKLQQQPLSTETTVLNLSQLAPGTYLLNLQQGERSVTKKFVKE